MLLVIVLSVILAAWRVHAQLRQAAGMRVMKRVLLDQKRHSNKRNNNRIIMSIGRADRRLSLFALVKHLAEKPIGKQFHAVIEDEPY